MWFNLMTSNHPPQVVRGALAPLVLYLRSALTQCGHEFTVFHDQVYPDAINLCIENFGHETDYATEFRRLRRDHGLRIGVVATEFMIAGTLPYARHGIGIDTGFTADAVLQRRVRAFEDVLGQVDFLWSILERNHLQYRDRCTVAEYFPVGSTRSDEVTQHSSPKDVDVVFFGRATPHRMSILKEIARSGLQIAVQGQGMPGGFAPDFVLESLLDRAKVGLNLSFLAPPSGVDPEIDHRTASAMRIKEMLDHDLCVVCEEIPRNNPFAPFMVSVPPERVAATCLDLVRSGQWQRLGKEFSERFHRETKVAKICRPVVDRTLEKIER